MPLQLENIKNHEVLWRNPHPSSSRFCRPIRIQYVRETAEVSEEEEKYLKQHIKNLKDFEGKNISVMYNLSLTMIDGKVRNSCLYYLNFLFICIINCNFKILYFR